MYYNGGQLMDEVRDRLHCLVRPAGAEIMVGYSHWTVLRPAPPHLLSRTLNRRFTSMLWLPLPVPALCPKPYSRTCPWPQYSTLSPSPPARPLPSSRTSRYHTLYRCPPSTHLWCVQSAQAPSLERLFTFSAGLRDVGPIPHILALSGQKA